MDRRTFLGMGAAAMAGAAAPQEVFETKPAEALRVGWVGVGDRGSGLARQMLRVKGCRITAVADLDPKRTDRIRRMAVEAGHAEPAIYNGPEDYLKLADRNDVDLVAIATPWKMHARMAVAALRAGKHAATETPAARTVEECWHLVESAEKAKRHCILMENYCYFREVMCLLNMIRQGVMGEVMHIHAGYQKDAMYYAAKPDGSLTFAGEGAIDQKGNYYPTHFAGPSSQWMNINRGDAFDYIVSMGTNARSFNKWGAEVVGPDSSLAKAKFDMADINNSLIKTKNGATFNLFLDTRSPRPYRHVYTVMASNGIYEHTEKRIHVNGRSPGEWTRQERKTAPRAWEAIANYYPQYEHPLWRDLGEQARTSGHNGGDFLCMYRLIEALRLGVYPDIDVYDTAAWSAIVELSDKSSRERSRALDFPDFTRGRWQTRKPLPITGAKMIA